jgi:hypothetical protein
MGIGEKQVRRRKDQPRLNRADAIVDLNARGSKRMDFALLPVRRYWPHFPQFHSQIFRFNSENCVDIDEATV